jgi:hypothetical protein
MYKLLIIGIFFLLGFYFIYKSNDIEAFESPDILSKRNKIAKNCPDVLIQKGSAFFLYNSKRASVPGINPIRFESLEEYTEFTEWQRSQGILCPILYLQHAYDAQGEPVYKARPSPTNLQGGQPDYVVTPGDLPGMQEIPINVSSMQSNMIPPPAYVPVQGLYGRDVTSPGANRPMPNLGPPPENGIPQTGAQVPGAVSIYNPNSYLGFDPHNQMLGLDTPLDKMYNQTTGVSPNPMDDNWGGVEYTENLVKSGYYKDNEVAKMTF